MNLQKARIYKNAMISVDRWLRNTYLFYITKEKG